MYTPSYPNWVCGGGVYCFHVARPSVIFWCLPLILLNTSNWKNLFMFCITVDINADIAVRET